jgi:uncharacterized membrane protein
MEMHIIKRNKLFLILYLTILILFSFPISLQAQSKNIEKILNYDSRIEVEQDGSMLVTENITVRCLGEKIKRGIYRDFPTKYHDRWNNRVIVEFKIIDIRKNGNPEPYHTESVSNGIRIYVGQKDVFLEHGIYTYTITYKTNRQLGFYKDHDELYWNVTGNGWEFSIETVFATIILPEAAKKNITETDAYTGSQGEKGKDFTTATDTADNPTFITTRPLEANEGLTIVVSWKKGLITEPSAQVKFQYFMKDNFGIIFAFIGFIIITIYYLIIWGIFGKDPAKGTIIPQYYPPKGFSPAAMRYITNMGFDNKTFAATVINLAVKGYLTIIEEKGVYTLTRKNTDTKGLEPEEEKIVTKLFRSDTSIKLESKNHSEINRALQELKNYLKQNYEKIYFLTNYWYFIGGLVLSIIILLFIGFPVATVKGSLPIFLFMCVWLTGWTFGVSHLLMELVRSWKSVLLGSIHKLTSLGSAVFITLFSIPFIIGEIIGIGMMTFATSGWFIVFFLILIPINYLFYHLLKAPTLAGRQILDKIEGFKMFLTITKKDRMNVLNPLGRTPEIFERYLPYALALDVEQAWANQFSDVLSRTSADGKEYSPSWYSGTAAFTAVGAGIFASSLGSSFSNAISSSSHAPGSSSGGGGGGSSGGGGGGGGGGGW